MFGLYMNSLYNYKLMKPVKFIIIAKLSYITYNELTKSLLIDNSLKKDLEMAQKRKLLNAKKKYKDNKEVIHTFQIIEMSESHETKPFIKLIK